MFPISLCIFLGRETLNKTSGWMTRGASFSPNQPRSIPQEDTTMSLFTSCCTAEMALWTDSIGGVDTHSNSMSNDQTALLNQDKYIYHICNFPSLNMMILQKWNGGNSRDYVLCQWTQQFLTTGYNWFAADISSQHGAWLHQDLIGDKFTGFIYHNYFT